ncbi:ABC transporter permease [Cytobacillus sp. IB215665]|uniref:ABC transporter permease n=1 Tax=Cytobacillus sp. IB215665 TaxID=3097357 RepID=UPI002A16310C|nr:ABC transporter permease [Cytobacillus sp. IB215665]MDX8366745.1 ABC transporter permease [Cytobacillus sp. IB215665]
MEMIKRFFRHATLSYKALFGWLDPKVYLFVMVLSPISQLIFFSVLVKYVYDGKGLDGFIASNSLLLCVMSSVFGMMSVITSDRRMGTLQIVISSPANKTSLFIARSFAHIINGLFTALIGLIVGIILFDVTIQFEMVPYLIFVWIVSIFAACGLGLIVASFCLWTPSMHLISNLLFSLLLLLSGANYPREVMPHWMYQLSNFFPLTRGVEATKLLVNHSDSSQVLHLMVEEFFLGCVFFLIGVLFIRYAEFLARGKGTMELD